MIAYPPLKSEKGCPTLGQNRQFQWFHNPCLIMPLIPASAATLLKEEGHEVVWKDCIAEGTSEKDFYALFRKEKPELIAMETKTPVVKQHWEIISRLKKINPRCKIFIMGDHVTALPKESLKNSRVDFVLTGGDFDFMLKELCYALENKKKIPAGFYYKKGRRIIGSRFKLSHNLDELPVIDREMVRWNLYQKEYNMKGRPYMYILSGRDCPWHSCRFCVWAFTLFPKFRARNVKNILDEISFLVKKYRVREIFDDTGTFPAIPGSKWFRDFCLGMIKRKLNRKIYFSCNMRVDYLTEENARMMKKAGFRLLKIGLESANQKTLDRINKGIKVKQIIDACKNAKKYGLTIHLTMIIGYPWETAEDAENTLKLAKWLMQKGYADVLQSTVLVPYPGTPIWKEALKNKWFTINPKNYEEYDMTKPVLKTGMDAKRIMEICNGIYRIFLTPQYIARRILSIRSVDDLLFNLRGVKAVLGHLKHFSSKVLG